MEAAIAQAGPLAKLPLAGKLAGFAVGQLAGADEAQLRASITMTLAMLQAAMDEDDAAAAAYLQSLQSLENHLTDERSADESDTTE